jgi:hydroxypyruvate isomerase
MIRLSANLEWMYTEAGADVAGRVALAAADGFEEVEIWGWRDKDVDALAEALRTHGVSLLSLIVDPQLPLTDPAVRADFLVALDESVEVARRLSSTSLVVVAGPSRAGVSREEQRAALVGTLSAAAQRVPDDITLLLEPLNDRVDHPGTFLTSTAEGLDIVEEVGSARLALLLDAYHALMMDERIVDVVGGRIGAVGHVQIADRPGRHEPGTGDVDWDREIRDLVAAGYRGTFGLEYMPAVETTASIQRIREIAGRI